jgi:hypothetical protein
MAIGSRRYLDWAGASILVPVKKIRKHRNLKHESMQVCLYNFVPPNFVSFLFFPCYATNILSWASLRGGEVLVV